MVSHIYKFKKECHSQTTPFSERWWIYICISITAWKVSKYGIISGPYFAVFGLNTERYGVSLHIQFKFRKIRSRYDSVFGHFSRSASIYLSIYPVDTRTKNVRTKDVHKRTFIFGSIWKHGKTSQSERIMSVPMRYVLKTSFSRHSFFFSLTHLKTKTTKISTSQSGFGKAC